MDRVKPTDQPPSAAKVNGVAKGLPVPLYHQIYLILRDEIISGQRAFGSIVPTEQELSRIYGVSRITTRRALDELAQNRLVARKRRVGTRVVFQPLSPPFQGNINQAVESLRIIGRKTKAKLVELNEEDPEPAIKVSLALKPGEKVIRAVRVRWLDDLPLGRVISYVPARLGIAFTRAELEAVPIIELLEQGGVKFGAAEQTVSANAADAALASVLDIDIRAPILTVARTLFNTAGEVVLFTLSQMRADRYHLRLDLRALDRSKPDAEMS
jgi:GntR family transcriptional regulator